MADIVIRAEVSGGAELDLPSEYEEAIRQSIIDEHLVLEIVKSPDCCPECRANEDPAPILMGGLHPNCRCRVREVRDVDGETKRRT